MAYLVSVELGVRDEGVDGAELGGLFCGNQGGEIVHALLLGWQDKVGRVGVEPIELLGIWRSVVHVLLRVQRAALEVALGVLELTLGRHSQRRLAHLGARDRTEEDSQQSSWMGEMRGDAGRCGEV